MIENNNNKDLVKESKETQDIAKQIVSKSLKLETVNEGNNEDDVLVLSADKTVKFIPRSEFGGDTGNQNLDQTLTNGNRSSAPIFIGVENNQEVSISDYSITAISREYQAVADVSSFGLGVNRQIDDNNKTDSSFSADHLYFNLNDGSQRQVALGYHNGLFLKMGGMPFALTSEGNTEALTLKTPNYGGLEVLPISVNGNFADATGNIEISTGGSTPTFDQILGAGFTATDKATVWRYSTEGGAGQIGVSAIGPMLIQTQDQTNAPELVATSSISPHEISIVDGMNNDFSNSLRVNSLSFRNRAGADGTGHANTFSFNHAQDNSLTESFDTKVTLPQNNGEHFLPLTVNGIRADKTGNIAVSSTGSQGLEDILKNNGEAFLEDGTCETDILLYAKNDTSTVVLSGAKGSDVTTFSIDNGVFSLRNKQTGFGYNTLKFDTAQNSSANNVNLLIPSKNSAGDYKLATEDQINLQKIVENGTKYTDQYGNKIEFREGFAGYNSTLSFYPTGVIISGIKNGKQFGASLSNDYVGASYEDKQIQLIPSEAAIYIQASYSASAKIRTNTLTADRNYQLPDKNGTIALTSDIATNNPNTVPLSLSYLNTSYPNAGIGFRVHCTGISGGGLIYEKAESGWVQYSVTKVN